MRAKNRLLAVFLIGLSCVCAYGGGDVVTYEEPGASATTSNVSRNGPFVGIEGSYVFNLQSDVSFVGGYPTIQNYEGSGGSFGVNIGAKQDCWRVLLGYEHYANDTDDQNYERVFTQVDYFPLDSTYAMGNMFANPYVGLNVGWLNYETSGIEDKNGVAYGGEAGFTKSFGNNWDMDMGVRYMFSNIDEVDHIGSVNVGLHYYY
jgi:hypothetical protein